MANENKITITTASPLTRNAVFDPIASMYPQTIITDKAVKEALNKFYGFTGSCTDDNLKAQEEKKEEEYVWVEGYKGTDKNMKCRDYQYELNKQFNMPDDTKIDVCNSGFHLCPELNQVFQYYSVGNGNRFFKVMALVPKKQTETRTLDVGSFTYSNKPNKYAAKSIIFLSECTPKEVLSAKYDEEKIRDLTDEEMVDVCANGDIALGKIIKRKVIVELVDLGYSEDIAKITFENDRVYLAKALAKQTNISWDTRILALITSNLDD